MRALTVTRVFLGAKGLRRGFASLPRARHARAHISQDSFRARDARAHVRKLCSGRTVRPESQVVIRFSVSRPFRFSGAQGARRRIAKRLGVAKRGMQWARQGAPRILSVERDAVVRDDLR